MQMELKKPTRLRRFLSCLFDLLLALVAFFLIYAMVVQPIYNTATKYKTACNDYYIALRNTNLYSYNETNMICNIVEPDLSDKEEVTAETYYAFYNYRLIYYYETNELSEAYESQMEKSGLFVLNDSGVYVFAEKVTADQAKSFYVSSIKTAIKDIFEKDETNQKLKARVNNYDLAIFACSFIPAWALIYIAIPLVNRGGQTLGKKLMNLKVASVRDGFKVKKGVLLLRQSLVVFVGYVLGIFTFGLSALAFMIVFLIHKEGKSIDDVLCDTIVYENVHPEDAGEKDRLTIALKNKRRNETKENK